MRKRGHVRIPAAHSNETFSSLVTASAAMPDGNLTVSPWRGQMEPVMSARARWLSVLAAGLIMGAALGIRNVQGLYLLPVTMDRGWTREAFSFAVAMQNLVTGAVHICVPVNVA